MMSKGPILKFSLLLLTILMAASCGRELAASPASTGQAAAGSPPQAQAARAAKGRIVDLDATEFEAMARKTGGIYLDVRHPIEVARGHIAEASLVNIADPDFLKKVSRMQRSKPIFVYCASGYRSAAAARQLQTLGFAAVYNLRGGITAWQRAGMPVVRGDAGKAHADGMSVAEFDRLIASPQPVLIDFHTPWCAPCKRMAPVLDAMARDHAGKAKVLRVDIDRAEALAIREHIEGVPVFVLFKAGKELWRHSGELDRAVLEQRLAAAM